jgi:hypothetical protein
MLAAVFPVRSFVANVYIFYDKTQTNLREIRAWRTEDKKSGEADLGFPVYFSVLYVEGICLRV